MSVQYVNGFDDPINAAYFDASWLSAKASTVNSDGLYESSQTVTEGYETYSNTNTVTAYYNSADELVYYSIKSESSYQMMAGERPDVSSRLEVYNVNDDAFKMTSTNTGPYSDYSSSTVRTFYGAVDDPATYIQNTYNETFTQSDSYGSSTTVTKQVVSGQDYIRESVTISDTEISVDGLKPLEAGDALQLGDSDSVQQQYQYQYRSAQDRTDDNFYAYQLQVNDAAGSPIWRDSGDGVAQVYNAAGDTVVRYTLSPLFSVDNAVAVDAQLSALEFVSASNAPRYVFDASSAVAITDITEQLTIVSESENGETTTKVLFFDALNNLRASVSSSTMDNSSSGVANLSEALTVSYFDAAGALLERVEETYTDSSGQVESLRKVYDASLAVTSTEILQDGVIKIYSGDQNPDNLLETKLYLTNLEPVSNLDNGTNLYDDEVKASLQYFESDSVSVVSYVDLVNKQTSDMATGAYGDGGGTYTWYDGKILLIDGNGDYLGAIRVSANESSDGNNDNVSLSFVSPEAENEWDSFGWFSTYGNSRYLGLEEDFASDQTLPAADTIDSTQRTYDNIRTNTNSVFDADTSTWSDTYKSVEYYDGWTLVYAEQTEGVLTTVLGANWKTLGVTVSNSITLDDLAPVTDGAYAGMYKYESTNSGSEMYGMDSNLESDDSKTITYLEYDALADSFSLAGREEIWSQTYANGDASYSLTRYDSNNKWVYNEWDSTWSGGTSRGSNGREVDSAYLTAEGNTINARIEYGSYSWDGQSNSYRYVYDKSDGSFVEGYQIDGVRKTIYGADWNILDVQIVVDTSDASKLFELTGGEFEGRDVLQSKYIGDDSQIKYAYIGAESSRDDTWGSSSERTIYYLDADKELLYVEREYTYESNEGYEAGGGESVNYNYETADGEWIGSRSSGGDGSIYSSFSYTEGEYRYQVSENSYGSGWVESTTYQYAANGWTLISGVENKNGLITTYDSSWNQSKIIDVTQAAAYEVTADPDAANQWIVTLKGDEVDFVGSDRRMEIWLDIDPRDGNGLVTSTVSDTNIIKTKDIWRYADTSGGYWSESFSLFSASGEWLGSGSEDSTGYFSSNQNIETSSGRTDSGTSGQKSLDSDGNWDGSTYLWTEGYEYNYNSNWQFTGGWQIRGGVEYTYGSDWSVTGTRLVVADNQLTAVRDSDGVVTGYIYEQPLGGAMMYGAGQDENSNTRTLFIDTDKQTILGSKETWAWSNANGDFWNKGETYYDAEGNWVRSTYESSDGYKSSNSQEEVYDAGNNLIGYLSSGSTTYRNGDSYEYSYEYNSSWGFQGGYEIRDGYKITYDASWNELSKVVYDDGVYEEILDQLGNLTGYETTRVKTLETEVEGATLVKTVVRSYDTSKDLLSSTETSVWTETGYSSTTVVEKDADAVVLSTITTDSAGWKYEEYFSTANGVTTERGKTTDPDGDVFEWTYRYDSNGDFVGGSETSDGIKQTFDAYWAVVEISVADIDALDAIDGGGYTATVQTVEADPYGYYELIESSTYQFDASLSLTSVTETSALTIGEQVTTEVRQYDGDLVLQYSRVEDSDEYFLDFTSSSGTEIVVGASDSGAFISFDDGTYNWTLDNGVINGDQFGTVQTDLAMAPEIIGQLLSTDDWEINDTNFDTYQSDLFDQGRDYADEVSTIDPGQGDRLIIAKLLSDYSKADLLRDDDTVDGVLAAESVGGFVSGDNAYIRIDSGDGHWMVLEGDTLSADDNDVIVGTVTKISLYQGDTLPQNLSSSGDQLLATLENQSLVLSEDWSEYLGGTTPYEIV